MEAQVSVLYIGPAGFEILLGRTGGVLNGKREIGKGVLHSVFSRSLRTQRPGYTISKYGTESKSFTYTLRPVSHYGWLGYLI